MSDIAIQIRNLSKRYRIGLKEKRHRTLGAAIGAWVRAPIANFQALRRLSRFSDQEEVDTIWALKDVSFDVQVGEVVGIIGSNGAGKSTLLKIISRITEPTQGRAVIRGTISSLLEVGTGFHQELTGRENVYLNGTILGMSKKQIDSRFDEIVAFAEFEKFIDTPIKHYSSGMKVRLAFSVAAHLEPDILIIDEVLAVGDIQFQKKCLGKMEDVSSQGRTVLFVSHNLNAVRQLCKRCIVLENGKVRLDAETDEAINLYHQITAPERLGEITTEMHRRLDGLRFLRVGLTNNDGAPLHSPKNFSPVVVRVDFELLQETSFPIVFTVGLDTVDGVQLTRISTELDDLPPANFLAGKHSLFLEVEFPFSPGFYTVVLRADRNQAGFNPLAIVRNAMRFELQEADIDRFSSTGKLSQLIPVKGKWSFEYAAIEGDVPVS